MDRTQYVCGPFTVTHVDVGATLQTLIHMGPVLVASYLPGTRHVDMAQETADEIVRAAMGRMTEGPFAAAMLAANVHPIDGIYNADELFEPDVHESGSPLTLQNRDLDAAPTWRQIGA